MLLTAECLLLLLSAKAAKFEWLRADVRKEALQQRDKARYCF